MRQRANSEHNTSYHKGADSQGKEWEEEDRTQHSHHPALITACNQPIPRSNPPRNHEPATQPQQFGPLFERGNGQFAQNLWLFA